MYSIVRCCAFRTEIKAKTTSKKLKRKKAPVAVESVTRRIQRSPVPEPESDFKTDILRSARKAALTNSGSIPRRRKPPSSVQRRNIRKLTYSSDDEEKEDKDDTQEEGERGGGIQGVQWKITSQYTFSDDDI